MKNSKLRLFAAIILAVITLSSAIVLADTWRYSTEFTVQDASGADRVGVPALISIRGQNLVDAGYVNSDATDTKILEGSVVRDYLITNQRTSLFIPSLAAYQQRECQLYTGYSPIASSFGIIVGTSQAAGIIDADQYITGDDGIVDVYGTTWAAQTFIASSDFGTAYSIVKVQLKLHRVLSPGTLTISIRATSSNKPTGADLTSGTTDGDTLTIDTDGEWRDISLTPYSLTGGTEYAIVAKATAGDASNKVAWLGDGTIPTYSNGFWCSSANSGVDWTEHSDTDVMFKVYRNATSYVTAADNADLEFGGVFTIETAGWINTTSGADKNIVYKEDAFKLWVSDTETIRAAILGAGDSETKAVSVVDARMSSQIMKVKVEADSAANMVLTIWDESGTQLGTNSIALAAATVPDNGNIWNFFQNDVMPYVEYVKFWT